MPPQLGAVFLFWLRENIWHIPGFTTKKIKNLVDPVITG